MRIASSTVHGQFVSSMRSTSAPAASRAAATDSTSIWCSFTAVKPSTRAAETACATWVGVSKRSRLAYARPRDWQSPPMSW